MSPDELKPGRPELPSAPPWRPRDAWLGVFFVAVGALVTANALLARSNGMAVVLWGGGIAFGPLLLLLGVNAIVRSLLARR